MLRILLILGVLSVFPILTSTQTLSADPITFKDCDDCPLMVIIPSGTFVMGSPDNEDGRWDNESPTSVVAVDSFMLGVFEITHDNWENCVEDGGCYNYSPPDYRWGRAERPVTDISYLKATSYIEWLSEKTGVQYRLPSEAEWEYSARAGTDTRYYWGDDLDKGHAVSRSSGTHWSYWKTAKVDQLEPNPWGLHHILGNVWELTANCWTRDYNEDLGNNPYAAKRSCGYRMIRGGSFLSNPDDIRSAARIHIGVGESRNTVGFRVARDLP